ncbi:MAG TPA: ABC transporter permease [Terriglobales bacterium]
MKTLFQDLRFGLRMLMKSPGFTSVAVVTLALGIGANTAIFSLVNGILLAPLPFAHPEQLVSVDGTYPRGAFAALREQARTMEVAAYAEGHEFNLTGVGEPVRLTGTLVSAELFSVLGTRPEFGRTFSSGEDVAGQDSYVVLSHALWQQRFGSDPSIIGRSIEIEGVSRQVLGVMPPSFRFPSPKTQIWVPLHIDPRNVSSSWASDYMPVIGRLRPGATLAQANAEIRMFQSHVGELFPWKMPSSWNANISVAPLKNRMVADVRNRLLMLLAAVALILLIACANVANLMLSRAAIREKEISIRSALGAASSRIVRQLLTESVLLASIGGALGIALAAAGLSLLKSALPADTPRLTSVHLEWPVLAFAAGLSVLTGIIFGFAPAIQSSRAALTQSLRSGGRGSMISVSQRLRSSLAIAEVGLASLLIIAAGLLIRSFWAQSHLNPGFRSDQILTARITPNESFCSGAGRCQAFYQTLLDQIQGATGVQGAALINTLPLGGRVTKRSVDIQNFSAPEDQGSPLFWMDAVTPSYFRVMGISLLSGRPFSKDEVSGNPSVAIVTAETARRYWPGKDAIGQHIRLLNEKNWRTVVGVTIDVHAYDLTKTIPDWIKGTVYVPYSPTSTAEDQRVPAEMTIAIRSNSGPTQLEALLRRTVAGLNNDVPVSEVRTMHAVVSEAESTPASTTSLFVTFAALALVLGIVGIYGVLAFLVSKRTQEIGIRMALGAQRSDVMWLVLREGAKFALVGIALGLGSAFVVTRWLASELYGVSSVDPLTYGSVAAVMLVITMLACYVPARRAMSVDPLIALRLD